MLLRDNPQRGTTPVIFLTAKDTDADEERAFQRRYRRLHRQADQADHRPARTQPLLVRQARHWLQDQNQALEAE